MAKTIDEDDQVEQRPVWAWIDQSALRHNARRALECARGRTVIGVVKADGYGHGAGVVARALLAEGVTRLAVVSVAEGGSLRRSGIVAPILLLGGLDDRAAGQRAVKWGLTPVLQDARGIALAASLGKDGSPLTVEVEVDTGMRRMGVPAAGASELIGAIEREPRLTLGGVFTHLARADEGDPKPCRAQVTALAEVLRTSSGVSDRSESHGPLAVHVANSGGLLRLEEIEGEARNFETTAVRPGLMLYGVSPITGQTAESQGLEPVMTLAARVVSLRRLVPGDAVGYGGEWVAEAPTTVATLPLGYADGIPRAVFGRGEVHLAGAMRPIVGRVSMDSVCVDVGNAEVAIGDVAIFFGRTPEGVRVPVEAFAAAAGTIGYEILVGIGSRVPRWIGSGWLPHEAPEDVDSSD